MPVAEEHTDWEIKVIQINYYCALGNYYWSSINFLNLLVKNDCTDINNSLSYNQRVALLKKFFINFTIDTAIGEQINFIDCYKLIVSEDSRYNSKERNISATKSLVENLSNRDYWSGSANTFHASVERYSTLIVTISLFVPFRLAGKLHRCVKYALQFAYISFARWPLKYIITTRQTLAHRCRHSWKIQERQRSSANQKLSRFIEK